MDNTCQKKSDKTWHHAAIAILDELFPQISPADWDLLLELRQHLAKGSDWEAVLDSFIAARHKLEQSHYMPFYRLRQLVSCSLRLEIAGHPDSDHADQLRALMRKNFKSLNHLRRHIRREFFELNTTQDDGQQLQITVTQGS